MNREELLQEIEKEFGAGCMLICKERARQKEVKGYDVDRDKNFYRNYELAQASVCYGMDAKVFKSSRLTLWPWDLEYFNPSPENRMREFEKSGALMAAQIDVENSKK